MADTAIRWHRVFDRTTRVSAVVDVRDDHTGERLPRARVRLADGTRPSTVSGGYHVFTDLEPEPVEVRVTATGYDEAARTVTPVGTAETDPAAFVTEVRVTPD